MKISRLKEDIKKKNVEVESLKKKMELKQAEIQTINKMKQEQIENLIHEQQMSARK